MMFFPRLRSVAILQADRGQVQATALLVKRLQELCGSRQTDPGRRKLCVLRSNQWKKTFYDPERDGIRCRSLGVQEHWNNGTDKKYSRNLGKAHGIDLFQVGSDA
jgi:hypothetical protein